MARGIRPPLYHAPGVYVTEVSELQSGISKVPTGLPAFLGYTQQAADGAAPLLGVPTRIGSMAEFETYFGGAPAQNFTRHKTEHGDLHIAVSGQRFFLYRSLQLYFDNGGGPCWIVSVGLYDAETHGAQDFTDAIWSELAKVQEPSIYAAPDAVALDKADHDSIAERLLLECAQLRDRFALLDVFNGASEGVDDVIDGPEGFRSLSFPDDSSYGAAYYPWLNTSIVDPAEINFTQLGDDSRLVLADEIEREIPATGDGLADALRNTPASAKGITKSHKALLTMSEIYRDTMQGMHHAINVLPTAGAVAGLYARTDSSRGVGKAPAGANAQLFSVVSPCAELSDAQQQDLNVPLLGRAVNPIRSFPGLGAVVWGARTLDGNSQDFRHITVRRTIIMLEQSIKEGIEAYRYEPNVPATWATIKSEIERFLSALWGDGALIGATHEEAYNVALGLGSTMTENDIAEGVMRASIHIAGFRPAEFIVLSFEQKMQPV